MLKFQLFSGGVALKPMTLNALLGKELPSPETPQLDLPDWELQPWAWCDVNGEKSPATLVVSDAKDPDTEVIISSTFEGIKRIVQSKRLAVCETLDEVELLTRRI